MTEKEKLTGRPLTPKLVRKRLKKISGMSDEKARKRALRRLRIKVLKRIGEGAAHKPRECASAAVKPLKDPSIGA